MRSAFIVFVALLLAASAAAKPNIVLIVADDLGWADLTMFADSPYETPYLEGLAEAGVVLTDMTAYPVCSPSRAQLLTGQNPARLGLTDFLPGHWRRHAVLDTPPMPQGLPKDAPSLGRAMTEAGYRTAYFGKWHLGDPLTNGPGTFGYGTWAVTKGAHRPERYVVIPDDPAAGDQPLSAYLVSRFRDHIERSSEDAPFYVELHPYLVHIPLEAAASAVREAEALLASKGISEEQRSAVYAAMVNELDGMVGDVLDVLTAAKVADETIIIFTSDNGGLVKRFDGAGPVVTSNAPLRGEKGTIFEGGVRIPFIAAGPGIAEGRRSNVPATLADIFPTLMDMIGNSAPESSDGQSLVKALTSDGAIPERPIVVHYPHYHHGAPASSLRLGRYKLVKLWETGEEVLYDLETDPSETTDTKAQNGAVYRRMSEKLTSELKAFGAVLPRENWEYDPERAHQWWYARQLTPAVLDALLAGPAASADQ